MGNQLQLPVTEDEQRLVNMGDRLHSLVNEVQTFKVSPEDKCICGKQLKAVTDHKVVCRICDKNGAPDNIYWCKGSEYICFDCCNTNDRKIQTPKDSDDEKYESQRPEITSEKCAHKIAECPHLSTMLQTINKYMDREQDISSDLVLKTLNSYHHLMHQHNNDEEFEYIVNQLKRCDITQCARFARNNRDRDARGTNEHNESVHVQIMDKIHCYFSHCYDIGNRISLRDKQSVYTEANDTKQEIHDEDEDVAQYLNNKMIMQTKQILNSKQMVSKQVKQHTNTKFNQLYAAESDVKNTSQAMYSFGYEFQYGYEEEGASLGSVPILPKYCSLKEELTSNKIAPIIMAQYNNEYQKAQLHLKSYCCKKQFSPFTDYLTHMQFYISINHLLALMIYCNYDHLQCEFSKTYRTDGGVTHREFYWLGRFLKLSLHRFGTRIYGAKVDKFYHGVSEQLLFPQYVGNYSEGINIYCPLSTTSSFAVATKFANETQGLIVHLHGFEYCSTRFFSVSWLSDFNESEYFFIQNDGTLFVKNVFDVQLCCEYGPLLEALKFINQIIDIFDDDDIFHSRDVSQSIRSVARGLILQQLAYKKTKSLGALSEYAKKICNIYFENTTFICFDFVDCKAVYSFIADILFYTEYDWVDMHLIHALFPNLNTIEMKNVNLCPSILKDILSTFQRTEMCQLKTVHIEPNKNSELNTIDAIKQYTKLFRDIGVFITADIEPNKVYIDKYDDDEKEHLDTLICSAGERYFEDINQGLTNRLDEMIAPQLSNRMQKENKTNENESDDNALKRIMMKMKNITNLLKNDWLRTSTIDIDLRKIKSNPNLGIFEQFYYAEYEWVKLEMLNALFPDLEEVKVSHVYLSSFIMDDILKYLTSCANTSLMYVKIQLGTGVKGKASARKSDVSKYSALRQLTGFTDDIDDIDENDWQSFDVLYEFRKGIKETDANLKSYTYYLDSLIVSYAVMKYKERFKAIEFELKQHEDIDDVLCIQKEDQYNFYLG